MKHCATTRPSMDEVLFGSVWNTVGPMLETDDVVRMRVAPKCWNDGRRYGKMGNVFFQLLHSDLLVKHWYQDAEGYKLCTLRYSIMGASAEWAFKRPRCSFRSATSVQLDRGLELDCASDSDSTCGAMAHGMRDSISITRECSNLPPSGSS